MKTLFKYIFPLWISMIINTLLGITDFLFLGSISEKYLTVVGVAFIPFTLISSLLVGVGIETNRATAKKTPLNIVKIIIASSMVALLIGIISNSLSEQIFFFAKVNNTYNDIRDYFSILIFSLTPTVVLYVCTGILRGNGVPHKSIYFSVIAVVLNFIFDYVFIKINLFGNPLNGCAFATLLSDSLVAVVYVLYIFKNNYAPLEKMDIRIFFKNASTYSLEKLFSASTVLIISSIYIAGLTLDASSTFFSIDRLYAPVIMFSYCYFEWVIYSKTKGLSDNGIKIQLLYFLFLIAYNFAVLTYLDTDFTGVVYSYLYVLYGLAFLVERRFVALGFVKEKGKIVNILILIKNSALVLLLQVFVILDKLSLISFGITNLFLLLLESAFLYFYLQWSNNSETHGKLSS